VRLSKITKKKKFRKESNSPIQRSKSTKATSRAGSHAGRGFRYQDAISAWLAVEIWAERRSSAFVIPEGGDDIEIRGKDTTTFIQVKSRRKYVGNYTQGEVAGYIEELWNRSLMSGTGPEKMDIILEREVTDLKPISNQPLNRGIDGAIITRLTKFNGASNLLPNTSIAVVPSPHECAINLIMERKDCSPITAQICFAELLLQVGFLANENGELQPSEYRGLSISDTETLIHELLSAVDGDALEDALKEGVCEPVDFITQINDPNFYLGVDVEPGHLAAGLVAERPDGRYALINGIEKKRAALIAGPSGAGKSALMWEAASALRHTVRWFRIRRLNLSDIPSLRLLVRTFRASEDSPVGFIMDDIGRNSPEGWTALLKEVMSIPGVVLLGSVREEDLSLIPERARAEEVRAVPDDDLAERLWQELHEAEKTEWAGWREPWGQSNGLLLEYVHILTRGKRMHELLADQVAARLSDPERSLELDILRAGAWAGAANADIESSRLLQALSVNEADLSRALKRLIDEHLVRSPAPGWVTGLHQLRSEELLKLTHQMEVPTLETSFERTVASVSPTDLEPLVADTISKNRLQIPAVLDCLNARIESEPDAKAFASSLRGLGTGRVYAGVNEWLDTPEAQMLPRTKVGITAMIGVAGSDFGDIEMFEEVQSAADRLSQIKGAPEDDPRRLLIEGMSLNILSALIEHSDLESLKEILAAMVGMDMPKLVETTLRQVPDNLLDSDLHLVGSILGTLATLNRKIAIKWVEEIGQKALFTRIQAEIAWAGSVTTDKTDDGKLVRCDYWYVAGTIQENPHEEVVRLCKLVLSLCPTADIVESNAITASGELAGLADYPFAEKRIPRENLPPESLPEWNRKWMDLISSHVAAPSYSDYLARGAAILETLVPTLEKIFDLLLRGKNPYNRHSKRMKTLFVDIETLTPPAISSSEASGSGSSDARTMSSTLQTLFLSVHAFLIARFMKLPEDSGLLIEWLNEQISYIDIIIDEEPWQLISKNPQPMFVRLKNLLVNLRALAGDAHERQENPIKTWVTHGKRAREGNAVKLISSFSESSVHSRLAERKEKIEQAAKIAGVDAIWHLRINPKGSLPWPPADVLALLPAQNTVEATLALDQQTDAIRSIVDLTVKLTIMPIIDGVVIPGLVKSGYQAMLPDIDEALGWMKTLELPYVPPEISTLFGEVVCITGDLSAMDQLKLGTPTRPEEEREVRNKLHELLTENQEELLRKLNDTSTTIGEEVQSLLKEMSMKKIDFGADMQAVLKGKATNHYMEKIGAISMLLIDYEVEKFQRK
jgi:hypothetical protein